MSGLVICSSNPGKIAEIRALLPAGMRVLSLNEAQVEVDLPETGSTLEDNALQKARAAHRICGLPCLADDSGLEVDALDGAPGVLSARFAGSQRDDRANIELLLARMADIHERGARFRTILALVDGGQEHVFEGFVTGRIGEAPKGEGGFGYDAVFIPSGHERTFAEMNIGEKNNISHRRIAIASLLHFFASSGWTDDHSDHSR
ncbi:MAG: RdgB/HAM1 family non-canonical purine NTP pyrophosphatase [Flavobacteriales bacterium]|nr:RdgB/HAM1 family non-canonical purine NTP pyrophosphatase [Flavobacteriales bacterium]